MEDDWSLEGKVYYPEYKHSGELHYTEVHIETLRQKLIEDLINLTEHDVGESEYIIELWDDNQKKVITNIINKRFGVDE